MNTPFRAMSSVLAGALVLSALSGPAPADQHAANVAQPLDEVQFQLFGDGPIEIAVLQGDPQTGPSAVLLRFPPNFPGGMHTHTHSYHAVVISGGSKHWIEGQTDADVPLQEPGDYWYQIGGQRHQDSFPTDEPTIIFLQIDGPLDVY